jgi:hypothetical protein
MKETIKTKKHLLVKRFKIIKFLKSEGYNHQEIATIFFDIDRSVISRMLNYGEQYKKSVKNLLKD